MSEFQSIREIAEQYERDLVPLRQRRDALQQQLGNMPRSTEQYHLRMRILRLNGMISSTTASINLMRKYWGDDNGR